MTAQFVKGGYSPFNVRDLTPMDASQSHQWPHSDVLWVHKDAKEMLKELP